VFTMCNSALNADWA